MQFKDAKEYRKPVVILDARGAPLRVAVPEPAKRPIGFTPPTTKGAK